MNNPFADYGKIVTGDRFIGRKKEINAIQNRIFGDTYGNIAIMGLPRIGKSSLAWKAVIERKNELLQRNCFPVRINMGDLKSCEDFFNEMLDEIHIKNKKQLSLLNQKAYSELDSIYVEYHKSNKHRNDRNALIEEYYSVLQYYSFRVIYILDEFDAVQNYFDLADFQFLRELSYNPDYRVCLVTLSRRTLNEIEPRGGALSNFYQIFDDLYLAMYNNSDMDEYWNKFFYVSEINISNEAKEKIYEITGKHPFLLDLFNFHLFNNLTGNLVNDIEKTYKDINLVILNNYKTIMNLLREENLDSKILQMTVGPVYDITTSEAEKLERYGLVNAFENTYQGFSKNFYLFLRSVVKDTPIWYLWSETEIKLRECVKTFLIEKFGEDWEEPFLKAHPEKTDELDKLMRMREKEKRSFGDRASGNLIDFTYPADIFNIFIKSDWNWFRNIFGGQPNDWQYKFNHLAKVRTPLAHNKENILSPDERNLAIGYCEGILQKINR